MIGKKIPNPAKSNALSARVERLADYIAAPENAPPNARALARAAKAARVEGLADYAGRTTADDLREKCVYGGARGFWTTTPAAQKMEMLALAAVSAHSKDPINHYVLSWREGERPTPAQIEEAVDIFLDAMGLADHQAIYGLHADTDNRHLHLMVNRVDPVTRKVVEINKGFDLEALHRAVALIERAQGWTREARGRYRVEADGTLRRDRHPPPDPAAADAQRVRDRLPHRHGATSAVRIAAGSGAASIRKAAGWAELHARLAVARARRASWTAERAALGAAHREQRDALWRSVPPGGWRGRGAELNAGRSLLAARQAGERAALLERQRRERRDLSGAAEAGREAEREIGSEDARRPAEQSGASDRRRARLVALILLEEEETAERPRDIRDFVAVICGGRVDYRRADDPGGPAGFADRGGEIAVHAERDRDTVRAALQLAAQKWGRFRVEGDDEYRALCASVAAECGLPLGEPEPLEAPRWPGPAAGHRTGPAP